MVLSDVDQRRIERHPFQTIVSWVLGLMLLSLVVVMIYLAGRQGLADFYYARALSQVENRIFPEPKDKIDALHAGLENIDRALAIEPTYAVALDYRGFLLRRLWQLQPDSRDAANSLFLADAEVAHRSALDKRPLWPGSYVSIAEIRATSPFLGADFYYHFDRAYELGRYEKATAWRLMSLGLRHWQQMQGDYQDKIMELTHLSLMQKSNQPKRMAALLKRHQLFEVACQRLPDNERKDKLCSY